jgi:hypothetical protein
MGCADFAWIGVVARTGRKRFFLKKEAKTFMSWL